MKKLLTNGLIYQENGFVKLDLMLENGIITAIGENLYEPFVEVIDCQGTYILPGIVDMHVHVGEKICNLNLADDWNALSRLADLCGINAIGVFITERSSTGDKQLLHLFESVSRKAALEFKHKVHWHLTPTVSEPEDVIPLIKEGCDLKFYTTYKPNGLYRSYEEIDRWMNDLKDLKPRLLVHCEDDEVVVAKANFHPFKRAYDHTIRRPEVAEIYAVSKILDLAVKNNYPVHIVHVSAPGAAMLIREARNHAPVTCETAPQYLLLNEDRLKDNNGHRWICTPPLRSERSRGMLLELLQDGLFDAIATDHCPFSTGDKDVYKDIPERIPCGIAGLGATLPILFETLVKTGKLPFEKLIRYISTNPARLMNLTSDFGTIQTGIQANLIIMQQNPVHQTSPITSSLSDTPNPWEGYSTNIILKRV